MKQLVFVMVIGLVGFAGSAHLAEACGGKHGLLTFVAFRAVDSNVKVSDAAIAELREAGPEGLSALLRVFKHVIPKYKETVELPKAEAARRDRLFSAIDRVAGQRNAAWSGLFWHTDIEKAKAAAKIAKRPILSLRLLT